MGFVCDQTRFLSKTQLVTLFLKYLILFLKVSQLS